MADPDFTYGPNARSRPGWCRDCTGTSRSRRRSHLASRRGRRRPKFTSRPQTPPLLCRRPADPFRRAAKTTRVRPSGVRLSGANSGLNEATSSRLIRDGRGLAWLQGGQYLASKRSSLTAHHASAESSRAGRCPSPGGPIYRVRRVSFRTTSGAVGAIRPGWFGYLLVAVGHGRPAVSCDIDATDSRRSITQPTGSTGGAAVPPPSVRQSMLAHAVRRRARRGGPDDPGSLVSGGHSPGLRAPPQRSDRRAGRGGHGTAHDAAR